MKVIVNGKQENYRTIWLEDSAVLMINQLHLPYSFSIHRSENFRETADAIKNMVVRGAPAIGAAAAYGMTQAASEFQGDDFRDFLRHMEKAKEILRKTRPTAYDLHYAIDYVMSGMRKISSVEEAKNHIRNSAIKYAEESVEACRMIGVNGEPLIVDGARILTHCNAGALGCVDYGTALSPMRLANQKGKRIHVFVGETRPRFQGSRLTAWELSQEKIGYTIIADNAAGYFMRRREIDLVIVGADRITSNGDVINKIGTYEKAVLAKENEIPFYVAAPSSTIDRRLRSGDEVEIEERNEEEVLSVWGKSENNKITNVRIAPDGSKARNPSFDVTPQEYVTKVITEKGVYSSRDLLRLL